jgi:DeoR/GlpR family transcriptional regulator of sugar metabolism
VIVMAESEKLQRKIPNVELPWSAISVLVTDDKISADVKQQIEEQGVDVICAKTTEIGA